MLPRRGFVAFRCECLLRRGLDELEIRAPFLRSSSLLRVIASRCADLGGAQLIAIVV